ncbi:RpiB/LacA/LacB family sugar-phosphate isomerase [Lactiplantibacillus nangangensis]|uniref:RpiB/LacA/LacB family sugar-phosphate isomerase n=1 Tax=Lactiplantibacillus nangangensis TaxID=2559917 RepID=A0ABW1SK08_9LACO|nr:RpiB/LacA/LacB family sugar-phosphate isomerase [Lactiplantibacillus nangangensis]
MKIAVIQATTQLNKNDLLFQATQQAAGAENEVINFGVFEHDSKLSYVQVSLLVGLLLNTKAVDYVITGCSSGNGMAIACNSLPNVICGYLPTPSDAYLFGRINHGNCASLPLGLNFGWAGELNLQFTLKKLFDGPMNTGYPQAASKRKEHDALMLQNIKRLTQTNLIGAINQIDSDFMAPIYRKHDVFDYIFKNGSEQNLVNSIKLIVPDY